MIEADDLRKLIDSAGVPIKAMILLGINAGFGQTDVAALPVSALDLEGKWLDFPRPKTHPAAVPAVAGNGCGTSRGYRGEARSKGQCRRRAGVHHQVRQAMGAVKPKQDEKGNDKAGVAIDSVRLEFGKPSRPSV